MFPVPQLLDIMDDFSDRKAGGIGWHNGLLPGELGAVPGESGIPCAVFRHPVLGDQYWLSSNISGILKEFRYIFLVN